MPVVPHDKKTAKQMKTEAKESTVPTASFFGRLKKFLTFDLAFCIPSLTLSPAFFMHPLAFSRVFDILLLLSFFTFASLFAAFRRHG